MMCLRHEDYAVIDAPENMEYRLGPLTQALAVVLWPAFISAVVATTVFFSQVDPQVLHLATCPEWPISRELGYTLGFFMFWAVTTLSSLLTFILLRTPAGQPAEGTALDDSNREAP
jgi:hypothetical protein